MEALNASTSAASIGAVAADGSTATNVQSALDALFVMDDTPTAQSNNAVTSNGIRLYVTNSIETAIGAIASSINTINGEDV